jgi:hypothetical protein
MTPDDIISRAEGTKTDVETLKRTLRKTYPQSGAQVTNKNIKAEAKRISEDWVTQLAGARIIVDAIEEDLRANLSVAFQRLYNAADKSAKRSTYDEIIKDINDALSANAILAIKTVARKPHSIAPLLTRAEAPLVVADKFSTAFVGHSFLPIDLPVAHGVIDMLAAVGVIAVTGEKPKAERISEKVKDLIDSQEIFVGVFTRRDKLQGRNKFTTTTWVLEEKAYAIAKKKRLILLREEGVETIGGLHGDHEYIEFSRTDIAAMLVKMLRMFSIRTIGLR